MVELLVVGESCDDAMPKYRDVPELEKNCDLDSMAVVVFKDSRLVLGMVSDS